ncbi:MAG: hypothetical protein DHS20C01_19400 [marine bacterium B5-7]|nr:MAG: hypothetical protein DHS20C01_19400 [marine bacterium B5-7]
MTQNREQIIDDGALRFDDTPQIRTINHPDWFKVGFLDLREDLSEAINSGKSALAVYFGQENCAYCKALMEVNFTLTDVVDYTRKNFDVVAIDIWGAAEMVNIDGVELTEHEFSIANETNFTPSFLFYDANGELVFRLRGYYPPYRFRAALEYVADGHYRDESFRSYLERAHPPPKFDLEELNEEIFFDSPPFFLDRSRFPASKPLVVFFEQRNCHACDVLHSDPLSDESTRTMLEFMQVVQLDMWSDTPVLTPTGDRLTARQWAEQLDISYAPTLVFFDERGREIIRIGSVVQQYRLGRVLQYVAESGYKSGLNYQQWHGLRSATPGTS